MYIRRKVFSKLQTEDGQERYFSTTEFTLMSEAEQREFSKKDDDDEPNLSRSDRKAIERIKKSNTADMIQDAWKGDKNAQKRVLKRNHVSKSTAIGAGIGAGVGLLRKKGVIGSLIHAGAGAGAGALVGNLTDPKSSKYDKKDEKIDRQHDRALVASGKMSKKDFVKKWGN